MDINFEEREEKGHCDAHGDFTGKCRILGSKEFPAKCPTCESEHHAKQEAEDKRRDDATRNRLIEVRLERSGIPKRFMNRTLDNYNADPGSQQAKALNVCTRYADSFMERLEHGGGLLLCGNPGAGKTHLATAIANHVIRNLNCSAKYSTVYDLIRSIRSTWGRESKITELEAIQNFVAPQLLVLDEVGVQYGSESEKITLFEVLNRRYEEMRPSILISNLDQAGVAESIGERNVDRMREGGGAVIGFTWDSYRGEVHKDPALNVKKQESGPRPGEYGHGAI